MASKVLSLLKFQQFDNSLPQDIKPTFHWAFVYEELDSNGEKIKTFFHITKKNRQYQFEQCSVNNQISDKIVDSYPTGPISIDRIEFEKICRLITKHMSTNLEDNCKSWCDKIFEVIGMKLMDQPETNCGCVYVVNLCHDNCSSILPENLKSIA